MSDLISRIELLKRFCVTKDGHRIPERDCDNFEVTVSIKDVKTIIKEQPTAYSVDKVVDELEELKNKDICDYLDCDVCLYYKKCGVETDQSNNLKWDKAIEIVKHGCVSDDFCEWRFEDEEANLYLTRCQQRQLIFDGTPKENGYRYCPYCGKKIKVVGDLYGILPS